MERPVWDKGSSLWKSHTTADVETYVELLEKRIVELAGEVRQLEDECMEMKNNKRLTELWARGEVE